eukprot:gb/GEZN01010340.1/.p1 GENE.gb/GEZN01010340.1/~~gb/GEZN01010340.1/.p1  ORF type:complete len:390 (+),score=14.93 gb/GEZN01010340.1/:27-1196(+)
MGGAHTMDFLLYLLATVLKTTAAEHLLTEKEATQWLRRYALFTDAHFGGYHTLAVSLFTGLSASFLAQLEGCPLAIGEGWGFSHRSQVLLNVNAEDRPNSNHSRENSRNILECQKKNPNTNCHVVILGNHWDSALVEYFDDTVSSLYIPFASTNFAERHTFTPLDLLKPRKQSRTNCGATVFYAQSGCSEWREQFWDILNEELRAAKFDAGVAARCNGYKKLGHSCARLGTMTGCESMGDICTRGRYEYDDVVRFYSHATFVAANEHDFSNVGYFTEKLMNVLLGGAIPIYGGNAHVRDIVPLENFIWIPENNVNMFKSAAQRVVALLMNKTEQSTFFGRPAIHYEAFKKYFTWHSSTFANHTDFVRQRIVAEIVKHCRRARNSTKKAL